MTDQGTRFDDEFLSAYLDDELAPEERARVERRLAADPAARMLLDELRAVSQATKELPPEKLDGDIRDTILRRAERAMLRSPSGGDVGVPASAGGTPVQRRDEPSRFTIGRSPRGWMWAGLAVAAALMLMAIQSEPEHNDKLPTAVAARSEESSEPTVERGDRLGLRALSREMSSVDEAAPPLADARNAPRATPRSSGNDFATSSPASAVAQPAEDLSRGLAEMRDDTPAATGGALARSKSVGESAAIASAGGRESENDRSGGVGGAVAERSLAESIAVERDAVASEADDTNWLVVHLQCKPEALERKVFDETLLKNNITIEEPQSAGNESVEHSVRSNRETSAGFRFESQSSKERTAEASTEARQSFEAVLVEAYAAQCQDVMEDIEADNDNFTGVVVEEPPAMAKKASAKAQNGVDWQRFSRGQVQQQGKLEQRAGNYYYCPTDREPILLGRTVTDEAIPRQRQTLGSEIASGVEQGRAQRLQRFGEVEQRVESADVAGLADKESAIELSASDAQWGLARRGAVMLPKAKANLLQILFVLQADDEGTATAAAEPSRVLQKED